MWLVLLIVLIGGGWVAYDFFLNKDAVYEGASGSDAARHYPRAEGGDPASKIRPTPDMAGSGSATETPVQDDSEEAPEPELEPVVRRTLATLELQRIHAMVLAWRFDEAVRELEQYLSQEAEDLVVRKEAERRLTVVKGYVSLRDALVSAITSGSLRNRTIKLPGMSMRIRLRSADASGMYGTYKGAKFMERWTTMSPDKRAALFDRVEGASAAQLWSRAELAFTMGNPRHAERALVALWKAHPSEREAIDDRLAAMRDELLPMGGYVLYEDRLVSAKEKDMRSRGLLPHEGKWVSEEDRKHLRKNHVKIDGRWTRLTAKQMKQRGFIKFKGSWYTPKGYALLRQEWEHAWVTKGTYWTVRNNTSETYCKQLTSTLDQLYAACNAFYTEHLGALPPTEDDAPLSAFAFAHHDAYARYLKSIGRDGDTGVPSITRPSKRMIAVWRWIDDEGSFTRTTINAATRVIWRERFREPPYWLDRGLAAYFEGFSQERNSGKLVFHGRTRQRLSRLLSAIRKKKVLPVAELVALERADLSDDEAKRRVVHAQAWGLVYFLTHTKDQTLRKGFDSYLRMVAKGQEADLVDLLGIKGREKDFARSFRNYIRRVKAPSSSWLGGGCKCAIK